MRGVWGVWMGGTFSRVCFSQLHCSSSPWLPLAVSSLGAASLSLLLASLNSLKPFPLRPASLPPLASPPSLLLFMSSSLSTHDLQLHHQSSASPLPPASPYLQPHPSPPASPLPEKRERHRGERQRGERGVGGEGGDRGIWVEGKGTWVRQMFSVFLYVSCSL